MATINLSGCAIFRGDYVLLIHKQGKDFWELPGGIVKSKNPEEAALEKTSEQIGVSPSLIQQFSILEYQKDATNIEATIYECSLDPESDFLPGEGVEEVKWFNIKDLSDEEIGEDVKCLLEEV